MPRRIAGTAGLREAAVDPGRRTGRVGVMRAARLVTGRRRGRIGHLSSFLSYAVFDRINLSVNCGKSLNPGLIPYLDR